MAFSGGVVCVLGGRGFIGGRLVIQLVKMGLRVRVLTRAPAKIDGVECFVGDLFDPNLDLEAFFSGAVVLINCSGELLDERVMRALHVDAVKRLVFYLKSKPDINLHWIQLSSVGAYGPPVRASMVRQVVEASPLAPRGEYEVTKAEADEMLIRAGEEFGLPYSIVRPSIVFGKGMRSSALLQLVSAIRDGRFFYIGDAGSVAPYIHVDDVVACLILCMTRCEAKGNIFNISNDVFFKDFVEVVANDFGVPQPKLRVPEFMVRVACLCFGWLPRFPLSQRRVDALVARTTYPAAKMEKVLGFTAQRSLLDSYKDIL